MLFNTLQINIWFQRHILAPPLWPLKYSLFKLQTSQWILLIVWCTFSGLQIFKTKWLMFLQQSLSSLNFYLQILLNNLLLQTKIRIHCLHLLHHLLISQFEFHQRALPLCGSLSHNITQLCNSWVGLTTRKSLLFRCIRWILMHSSNNPQLLKSIKSETTR